MAYHVEHNLNWDKNEERAGDAFSAATRATAKAMLLEAQETPRARSVASSVRQVLSLRQATRSTLTDVLNRVEPECDANAVIIISATTRKEGFKTQLAAAHNGEDVEVSSYGGQVSHIGGYPAHTPAHPHALTPCRMRTPHAPPILFGQVCSDAVHPHMHGEERRRAWA